MILPSTPIFVYKLGFMLVSACTLFKVEKGVFTQILKHMPIVQRNPTVHVKSIRLHNHCHDFLEERQHRWSSTVEISSTYIATKPKAKRHESNLHVKAWRVERGELAQRGSIIGLWYLSNMREGLSLFQDHIVF